MQLDEDLTQAARKMTVMERVGASLPGLDCAPVVPQLCRFGRGYRSGLATESDCIFKLKEDSGTSGGALGFNQTSAIFYATETSGGDGGRSH